MSIRISRPSGALKFALKLPVHLYHGGLGWLLDHRFLLLTHRGRKSGKLYETVLEIVVYRPATGTCYVVSGWGDNPDWYRNIQTQPAVSVQVGRQQFAPLQHFLTPEEVATVWRSFRRKHPIEERIALKIYSRAGNANQNGAARRDTLVRNLRMVAFRPRQQNRG
ncbi:MAG: nitroreductase family deazaflavin-dependent oxidoreductase [Chloroflexota bacterium]